MQLMAGTGEQMKVGDIPQKEGNINAGVKYIRFMVDKYFANEPMDDTNKLLSAFASYNAEQDSFLARGSAEGRARSERMDR
jgi:membrane-bound lytic murein transglycosylase MltF